MTTCDGSSAANANAGVLPWVTLGLSRDQAADSDGNYYTYVVTTDSAGQGICESVTLDHGSGSETAGSVFEANLTIRSALGVDENVPFAIIGHGANGLGARTLNDVATGTPGTTETRNCGPLVCGDYSLGSTDASEYLASGPFAGSEGTTAFDDQVFVPEQPSLETLCQSLTPGGELNADLTDTFAQVSSQIGSTGLDSTKYSTDTNNVTVVEDTNNTGNQAAQFGAVGAILVTNTAIGGSPIDVSETVNSGDTITQIPSRIAANINGTSSLTSNGIRAYNAGAVVTIIQQGTLSATTQLSDNGAGATITFSPTTGFLAMGAAGGRTDFNYPNAAANPGQGGTTGNGNAGTVQLIW